MKPKVVLYDIHSADEAYFRNALGSDYELVITSDRLTAATAALAAAAEVIAVHVTSPVTAAVMKQMPKLRHVACRSTGFDHVDHDYAVEHGITVSTVPAYGESTVAEYAFLLLLAISRRLMLAAHAVQAGKAASDKLTGHDLGGRTLGIIGTGRIGRHAAGLGIGFGMKVVAYDPYPNESAAAEIGFQYLTLDQLLAQADYISLHAPATPETHHLLDAAAIAKTRPGVMIVNTARGNLIDTPALIQALESGQVAAAGLDVLEGEEFLQGGVERSPHIQTLSKMPNVLITGHNAYNSAEALGRIRDTTISNIQAWHAGRAENLVKWS